MTIQRANSAAAPSPANSNTGALVIRWEMTWLVTPPASVIAFAPRATEATRAPSVVASGAVTMP